MSPPPFVFNHKSGDLQREGKLIALCRLHADIFAVFAAAQTPIGYGGIAKAIGTPTHDVQNEMQSLIRRLKPLGIVIARSPRGSWLEFEDVPKWRPTIAPPIRLEGEGMP